MTVKLRTREGVFVAELGMPAFEDLPDAVLWEARVYCLRRPFKKNPEMPVEYYEAVLWQADVPEALKDTPVGVVYCPAPAVRTEGPVKR